MFNSFFSTRIRAQSYLFVRTYVSCTLAGPDSNRKEPYKGLYKVTYFLFTSGSFSNLVQHNVCIQLLTPFLPRTHSLQNTYFVLVAIPPLTPKLKGLNSSALASGIVLEICAR